MWNVHHRRQDEVLKCLKNTKIQRCKINPVTTENDKTVEVSTTAAVSATVYTTWDTWDTWDGDITMSRHHTSTETDVREPEVGTKRKSKDNISKNDSGKSESPSYELNSSKNLIWKVQVKINQVKILWYDQTLQNSYLMDLVGSRTKSKS